ncbi:hypothetical protein MC885_021779, partial [Smutsia gigantea]
MHLGAHRTRRGKVSRTAKAKLLLHVIVLCVAGGAGRAQEQGIDILHQLGLGGKDVKHSSSVTAVPSSSTPLPRGVHLTESEASASYCTYMKQQCRPETRLLHRTLVPAETPENSPLLKQFGGKVLAEDTLSEGKSVPNILNNDSATVHKQQEYQTPRSELTSHHSGKVAAVDLVSRGIQDKEMITEEHIQTNLSLSMTHHRFSEARTKSKGKLRSLLNVSNSITQHKDRVTGLSPFKKIPSILPHIKQDKIANLQEALTANLHPNELMELQQISDPTLHRVTDEPSADNHLDLRKEGELDPDATSPIENGYETELYDYYYYYEDLNTMLEMENLRGPKGDPGPP